MNEAVSERYLTLLKGCLSRELFFDEQVVDVMGWPSGGFLGNADETWAKLRGLDMRIVQPLTDAEPYRRGEAWLPNADTMVGAARLDNVIELTTRALREGVPGDFVETGVWRGGVVALMRGVLAAHDVTDRVVWACDSFQGLPEPDPERYPADHDHPVTVNLGKAIAISRAQVEANIARYGLLDEQVRFLEGWFRDTLPEAPIERIAVLRLDGDLYESTMDALVALEPRVSPGGFVLVDDYNSWEPCARAVDDYRAERGITAPIQEVDWTGVWWRKEAP